MTRATGLRLAATLAALAMAALLACWALLFASLPAERPVEVPGLEATVRIHYDDYGRPFVQAVSLQDALAAQGWLHASHRLWQMELLRRAGNGRLAELLGPDLLDSDRQLWRFGVPQLAARLQENASARTRELVAAYIAGINSAISSYRVAPPEFLLLQHRPRPWSERDVYALGALMAFQSAGNARRELLRLALRAEIADERFDVFLDRAEERSDYPYVMEGRAAATQQPAPATGLASSGIVAALARWDAIDPGRQPLMPRLGFGSNGWVVAPWRSSTGHALYAFDSHDSLGLPNLFYEVHLFFDEKKQLRGWSVPGLPGVINGYNESIAWGFTNIGDTQDLYVEQRDPQNPGHFIEDGESYPGRVETVTIPVRGAAAESLDIVYTRNGPVISDSPALSLRWTVQELGTLGLDGLLALNRATDWDSFNRALDQHAAPTLNATYADTSGVIGFRTAGLLPDRQSGKGLHPLTASAANRWRGIVPAADMPRLKNPDSGYIAAANARVNPPGRYPLVSADNAAPYRVQRLQDVLGKPGDWSPARMAGLQLDWYDSQAATVLPAMLASLPADEHVAEQAMLRTWANMPMAEPGEAAALLFQAWYLQVARSVFAPILGDGLYRRLLSESYVVNKALDPLLLDDGSSPWWDGRKATLLSDALGNASRNLGSQLGKPPADWRLDDKQSVGLNHELAAAVPALATLFSAEAQPWGGTPAAVGRANYDYREPFEVDHGATVRAVGSMGAPVAMASVIPGGQSGHPLSPHYLDQFKPWRRGELLPIDATPPGRAAVTLEPLGKLAD